MGNDVNLFDVLRHAAHESARERRGLGDEIDRLALAGGLVRRRPGDVDCKPAEVIAIDGKPVEPRRRA